MRAPRTLLVFAALAALGLWACSGLWFDQSNAFPCDFSKPAGERDAACAPGDVCGVDNLCRRYSYEGPQFEGTPTVPDFTEAAGAGAVLHPRRLDEPVRAVAEGELKTAGILEVHTESGTAFSVNGRQPLEQRAAPVPPVSVMTRVGLRLLYTIEDGTSHVQKAGGATLPIKYGLLDVKAQRMHAVPQADGGFVALVADIAAQRGVLGTLGDELVGRFDFVPWNVLDPDGGARLEVMDVGLVPRKQPAQALLVTPQGLFGVWPDAGAYDALEDTVDFGTEALIRFNDRGTVAAVASAHPRLNKTPSFVLSSFAVSDDGAGPRVERLWDDCLPCDEDGRALGVYPVTDSDGLPAVDVICESGPNEDRTLVRVVDAPLSDGSGTPDRCLDEYVEEKVPLWQVAHVDLDGGRRRLAQDFGAQSGVVLGGLSGEVWRGESPADALPLYLDRVPVDVEVAQARGQLASGTWVDLELPLVLTDAYAAVDEAAFPPVLQRGLANGYRRINLGDAREGFFAGDTRVAALMHQAAGWVVLADGQLVRVRPYLGGGGTDLDISLDLGPRLVNGRGDDVEHLLWGEGLTRDGGLSAVVAADDSLYFLGGSDFDTSLDLGDRELAPVLAPEPGVFIRHLALERTPVGSNGVNRMRGYAVTSRNVHRFELSGTPARWTSTPLALSAGTPLEVWFDHPRGGLARVGYHDGVVYTLPGGFQLTEPLPAAQGEEAPRVIDYENLGGWPVALTTRGLFWAQWDRDGDKLQNRFADGGVNRPMTWREVTWPDPDEPYPWKDEDGQVHEGRLFVRVGQDEPAPSGGYQRVFTLMLFLEDRVLQVGRHVRFASSTVSP